MTKETTQRFDEGLKVRRAVLGDAYVDKALANSDAFWQPLQEMVTEFCWGSVWTRDGLERRTRSLINIAMLSALNRPHEVEIHLRGAINNGCTAEDIREVILQVAAYCGVPAAIDTMRTAKRILAEAEDKI
ncbi:MAG: 4-carboxymuconolactone decarboxylase [Pseudomonadota bacterium]